MPDLRGVLLNPERKGKISWKLGPQGELRWLDIKHRAVLQ